MGAPMPTYFWQSATFIAHPFIAHFSSKGSPMKVSLISLTVVFALVGVSGSAFAESSSRYSGGGNVYEFKAKFDQIARSGEQVRIDGHCQSACTMLLGNRKACVTRGATLLFHAGASHHELDSQKTSIMLNHYNGKLRAYLKAHGAMETRSFTSISGSDIIDKFGYRECK
jgi:hypothetical protein